MRSLFRVVVVSMWAAVLLVLAAPSSARRSRQKRSWQFKDFWVTEGQKGEREILNMKERFKSESVDMDQVGYKVTGNFTEGLFKLVGDRLMVTHELDRETRSRYHLTLRAFDKATQDDLAEPVDIVVRVRDINDNSPVFADGQQFATVSEGAKRGTVVKTVVARDADDPDPQDGDKYGLVGYQLVEGGAGLFILDPQSGQLRLEGDLDREQRDSYNLVIKARDTANNPGALHYSALLNMTITVTDVNDNPPYFTKTFENARVAENAAVGTEIARFEARDQDMGENRQMLYSVVKEAENSASDHFYMTTTRNKGILRMKKALDYETTPGHYHVIRVRVMNERPLVGGVEYDEGRNEMEVRVVVTNEDEPPLITQPKPQFHVKENSEPGTLVGKLTAVDPENDGFGWLIEDPSGKFVINSQGEILVDGELDREKINEYKLTVIARSKEKTDMESRARVTVFVDDVNDNPPTPTQESMVVTLCQNRDQRFQMLKPQLSVVDVDSKKANGNHFTFAQVDHPFWRNNFKLIDHKDGTAQISTLHSDFDASVVDEYKLEYLVGDNGTPAMNATYHTTIRVCHCAEDGTPTCGADEIRALVGIGYPVVVSIVCFAVILVIVIVLAALIQRRRRRQQAAAEELLRSVKSDEDDVRDCIGDRYEGGGEEDNHEFDLPRMMMVNAANAHADAEPQITPRKAGFQMSLPSSDAMDFVEGCKSKMDSDPSYLPYDSIQVYNYEGEEGSATGSLSSLNSAPSSDGEHDYDYLREWGPKFGKLASLYGCQSHGAASDV